MPTKTIKEGSLPRFTVQMHKPLYKAINIAATSKECKVYELMNKILLYGVVEYSKGQDKKYKIDINVPEMAEARKMAAEIK